MKYILDTDTIIYFLKGNANVIQHLSNTPPEEIATTIINHTGLLFGAFNSIKKKQGNIIADLDLMIASIALKHQAILVTNNTKHFIRIKKLELANWYA